MDVKIITMRWLCSKNYRTAIVFFLLITTSMHICFFSLLSHSILYYSIEALPMTKEELLADLKDTYVMLKPSPVHGIGVFAIRDIPKGCRALFSKDNGEWMKVPHHELESLPNHTKDLVENYCVYDKDHYYIPNFGFKKVDLVSFLNHSDSPNITPVNDGEFFEATEDIASGQELFINYGTVVDY